MMYEKWITLIDGLSDIQRAGFAFLTSLLLVMIFGGRFIGFLKKKLKLIQPIRLDGPQGHLKKQGTPSLGGILIMVAFIIATLIWIKDFNEIIKLILIVGIGYSIIGLIDDLLKLKMKNSKGLSGKIRLVAGFAIAFSASIMLIKEYPADIAYSVHFPFFVSNYWYIGTAIFVFIPFVIVGTANSVNLTDGLDGLASMVTMTILIAFFVLVVLILQGSIAKDFSYNSIFYFAKLKEVIVLIAALIGSILGFLWFNSAPAKIFMGDVGSLAIGGMLGTIAVALKYELFLALVGLILILESLSVIIQVYYYKLTKKRVFLMAPLHHHFEKKGYSEIKIVKRIWMFTILCCILALLFVK